MTYFRIDDEIVCHDCGQNLFDGCECNHREWRCEHCGGWRHVHFIDFGSRPCPHCYQRKRERAGDDYDE